MAAQTSIKEKKKSKGRNRREYKRTPFKKRKKQYLKNFWIRIVKRKWVSQIDQLLTPLYISKECNLKFTKVPPHELPNLSTGLRQSLY
jgi:hypothetical protein